MRPLYSLYLRKALQEDLYKSVEDLAVDCNVAIDENARELFQEKALVIKVGSQRIRELLRSCIKLRQ